MRLYTSEKEAQVLQLALANLVTENGSDVAQTLLTRIAQCLDLQGVERRAANDGSTAAA